MALTGCAALSPVVEKAADAYDQIRIGNEITLCRGLSVAAVLRAYPAGTPEGDGWWGLCKKHYSGVTPPWQE